MTELLIIGISFVILVLLLWYSKSNQKINLLKKQIKILESTYQMLDASNKTIYTITTQNDRIIEAIENNTNILERSIEKQTSSRV